ncbi:hypothetical protein LIER_19468 [Lithospermum erythrorhizon]|uniref:Retroviral polymerase SH3-like domain-containing protein n=1 Tax=Lithospermum erythrorhizon TaxID=34254 RepID=A0AAV3QIR2_LITER
MQKFNVKSDEGIFLGYSRNSRALCVFNKRTKVVMESMNVNMLNQGLETCEEDAKVNSFAINNSPNSTSGATTDESGADNSCHDIRSIQLAKQIQKNYPVDNIIGQLDHGITTRRKEPVDYRKMVRLIDQSCFISKLEPKNIDKALKDEQWINAM